MVLSAVQSSVHRFTTRSPERMEKSRGDLPGRTERKEWERTEQELEPGVFTQSLRERTWCTGTRISQKRVQVFHRGLKLSISPLGMHAAASREPCVAIANRVWERIRRMREPCTCCSLAVVYSSMEHQTERHTGRGVAAAAASSAAAVHNLTDRLSNVCSSVWSGRSSRRR